MALDLSSLSDVGALLRAQDEGNGLRRVKLDSISPDPNQPRKSFDEEPLTELAESIRAIGIIQPPVVRSCEGGYLLISGERRWRAACQLGLEMIDVIVRDDLDARAQLVENIQREALSLWEIYRVITGELESGTTQAELARTLGKSPAWVAAYAAISKMPDSFVSLLRNSRVSDITTLGHLHRLHRERPHAAEVLLGSPESITRAMVAEIRSRALADNGPVKRVALPPHETHSSGIESVPGKEPSDIGEANADASVTRSSEPMPTVASNLAVRIHVYFDNASWTVDYTDQQRAADCLVSVKLKSDCGSVRYAPIEALQLQSIEWP